MHLARVKASAIKLLTVALIDYDGNGAPYCRSNNDSSLKVRLTATMSDRCGLSSWMDCMAFPERLTCITQRRVKNNLGHGRRQF
jgi:hypothetical protein